VLTDDARDAISAEVARILSEERRRRGISMNALAEKSGLSQSLISSFETIPWNPTLDSLLRVASVLEVNLGDVIRDAAANVQARTAKRQNKNRR
jgi:transcriptional regulator with XRE-family HTH domain